MPLDVSSPSFHDWFEMTGYDSSCRKRITEWTVKHLSAYAEVHAALRSKLVAMGVQVAEHCARRSREDP